MKSTSFITNCFIVRFKLRNTNRHNCWKEIPLFTIPLIKVSREGILFYASVTTKGSYL